MIVRLRDYPSAEELAELYGHQYHHRRWPDHVVRVGVTVAIASIFCPPGGSIADLSCGDAAIAEHLGRASNAGRVLLGDITPGRELVGPIEETITRLAPDSIDLFVLSETIEHVAEPGPLLRQIRKVAHRLVLSTPVGERPGTVNREHIWGWDVDGIWGLLREAGWSPLIVPHLLDLRMVIPAAYEYQIWVCG